VVILYKLRGESGSVLEHARVEAFEKEPSRVAEYLGLDDQDIG
jgi:hypothetical protein